MSNEYKPTYVDNADNSISIMENTDTISFCKTGTKINTLSAKNVAHKKTGENLNLCAYDGSSFNPVITINNNNQDCRIMTNLNIAGNLNIIGNGIINTSLGIGTSSLNNGFTSSNVHTNSILDINGQTTIRGHILPSQNEQFDLGNAEYKIRHLFLSDNSLWIGNEHKIDISGGKMKFKKIKKSGDFIPTGLTDNATLQTAISNRGGTRANYTINDWNIIAKEVGVSNFNEVFKSDNSDNWEEDTERSEWIKNGNDITTTSNITCQSITTNNQNINVGSGTITTTGQGSFGNVGIGVTSPDAHLHIYKTTVNTTTHTTSTCEPYIRLEANPSADCDWNDFNPVLIDFKMANQTDDHTNIARIGALMSPIGSEGHATSVGEGSNALVFCTSYNTTLKERMRINHHGYVGIGTINPYSTLDINDNLGLNIHNTLNPYTTVKSNSIQMGYPFSSSGIDANTTFYGGVDRRLSNTLTIFSPYKSNIGTRTDGGGTLNGHPFIDLITGGKYNVGYGLRTTIKMHHAGASGCYLGFHMKNGSDSTEYLGNHETAAVYFQSNGDVTSAGTITANTFSGSLSGRSTYSDNVRITNSSSSASVHYIPFTSGYSTADYQLRSDYNLTYAPSGDSLSVGRIWCTGSGSSSSYFGGRVGIGVGSPSYPLHITSTELIPSGTYGAIVINAASNSFQWDAYDLAGRGASIKVDGAVWVSSYYGMVASSDSRIKINIVDVPDNLSLQQLRSIPCRYYEYIDKVNRGSTKTIGFIAQEVRAVMPMAISLQKEIIPDVYKPINCNWISVDDTFIMSSSDLPNVNGIKYKFYVSNESDAKPIELTGNSDNTFTFDAQYTNVFCYGSEVDDFHTIDKNKLFTLNFSATQEIDRIQQTHITEIALLKSEVSTLETENQQQQTKINELTSIIDKLKTANSFEEFKNSL